MSDCAKKTDSSPIVRKPPDMDDIRVYKITVGFADGRFRVYDGDAAFWGTLEQAIRMTLDIAQAYKMQGQTITLVEVREID